MAKKHSLFQRNQPPTPQPQGGEQRIRQKLKHQIERKPKLISLQRAKRKEEIGISVYGHYSKRLDPKPRKQK